MTSDTPSTTTPKSRRPTADCTDNTMMTVSGVYSARSRLKRMRRSTIGTIEPRRFSTPSTWLRRLRNARHRRPAADFLHAQNVHAVGFIAQGEGQHLVGTGGAASICAATCLVMNRISYRLSHTDAGDRPAQWYQRSKMYRRSLHG